MDNLENEIYAPIVGFDGKYSICKSGRIFILNHLNSGRAKEIPQYISNKGYKMVALYFNKIRSYTSVHRLVAQTFILNPENKRTVNHIDGNKQNNNASNLEWATYSENNIHAYRVLNRVPTFLGKKYGDCPLSISVRQKFKNGDVKIWNSMQMAADDLGYAVSGISMACNGKLKTYKKCTWEKAA